MSTVLKSGSFNLLDTSGFVREGLNRDGFTL